MPTNSASNSVAAHHFVAYGGGLFGAGILLYQAWSGASLEHVLSSAATSGLMAYLTLAVGFAAARSVITSDPASPPSETTDASPEEATDEPDEADDTTAPKPQVA